MARQVEVALVQVEGLAYLLHLIDEPIDLPEVRVVRLVAVRRAQLVVVEVIDDGRREIAVASFPVLVSRGRPPVPEQALRAGVVADALGPDLEVAFGRTDRDHTNAAAEDVVAS